MNIDTKRHKVCSGLLSTTGSGKKIIFCVTKLSSVI